MAGMIAIDAARQGGFFRNAGHGPASGWMPAVLLAALLGACAAQSDGIPQAAPGGLAPTADWELLRSELARVLQESGALKRAAAPPLDARSQVPDLAIEELPGGGTDGADAIRLSWSYRSSGDYNQDGQVLASDLSSIGIHFGKRDTDATSWEAAQTADGNGDGIVSAQDLTPIGQFYRSRVDGYRLEYSTSDSPDGDWAEVSAPGLPVQQSSGSPPAGGGFLEYSLSLDLPQAAGFYRVVPFDATGSGIASLPAQYEQEIIEPQENKPPVAILSTTNDTSVVGTKITWDASASTDDGVGDRIGLEDGIPGEPGPPAIAKYEWDFDSDGFFEHESRMPLPDGTEDPESIPGYDPEDNSIPSPTADYFYFETRQHHAQVRVTDAGGLSSSDSAGPVAVVDEQWHVQKIGDSASQSAVCDLLLLDGIPSASYEAVVSPAPLETGIAFQSAVDPQGQSWKDPVYMSPGPGASGNTQILLLNAGGNPALFYAAYDTLDEGASGIVYKRALDSAGEQWPDGADYVLGQVSGSLRWRVSADSLLSGNPALCAAENASGFLFVQFTGNASGIPVSTLSNSYLPFGTVASLSEVNGLPAIVRGGDDLLYCRALDPDATEWALPYVVDFVGDTGYNPTLFMLGTKPAIVYYDNTFFALRIVLAADALGDEWSESRFITFTAAPRFSVSTLNDRVAIVYQPLNKEEFLLIAANDEQAKHWTVPSQVTGAVNLLALSLARQCNGDVVFAGGVYPQVLFIEQAEGTGDTINVASYY